MNQTVNDKIKLHAAAERLGLMPTVFIALLQDKCHPLHAEAESMGISSIDFVLLLPEQAVALVQPSSSRQKSSTLVENDLEEMLSSLQLDPDRPHYHLDTWIKNAAPASVVRPTIGARLPALNSTPHCNDTPGRLRASLL